MRYNIYENDGLTPEEKLDKLIDELGDEDSIIDYILNTYGYALPAVELMKILDKNNIVSADKLLQEIDDEFDYKRIMP
jgi:hypothetical protein